MFTGTLNKISRREGEQAVAAGGKAGTSVSKKTLLAVAGEKTGGKLDTAKN